MATISSATALRSRPRAASNRSSSDPLQRPARSRLRRALYRGAVGAVSGAAATVPMTLAMAAMHRRLPSWQRYRLPPRTITLRLADRVGIGRHLDEPARSAATVTGHFGYGALVGAVYAVACGTRRDRPLAAGAAFGLAVWGASYLGWIPAARIMRPATEQPTERTALMIAAHLVFGAATALAADRLGAE
jgi:hypothetical protein